jgi:hypothetical protein
MRASEATLARRKTAVKTKLFVTHGIVAFALATGCSKDDDGGGSGDDTGTGGDESAGTTTSGVSMSDTSVSTTASTTAGSDTGPGTGEDSTTGMMCVPGADGAMCSEDMCCESEHCFVVGILGGICGECESDADCVGITDGGCSLPNPLAQPPVGSHCNTGEQGGGCMSDDVCMDPLICVEILNVPGVLVANTCSACADDMGCMDGQLCTPQYDVAMLSGTKNCVDPGSVPDGEGCDFMGSGDMACMSGNCAVADVMGLLQLGVCSVCNDDMDCMMGEVCNPPEVDLNTMMLVPGACAPP